MTDLGEKATRTICSRCGQEGKHFVRPSGGQTGFYVCAGKPQFALRLEHYDVVRKARKVLPASP